MRRGSTSSSVDTDMTCVLKCVVETARLMSEKREEGIREVRRERLEETADARSNAPCQISLSAA